MRTLLSALCLSVAFLAGCVAASSGLGVGPARAQEGSHVVVEQRWAYFCFESNTVDDVNARANAAGTRGWEMVASGNGEHRTIWCFRQPKP